MLGPVSFLGLHKGRGEIPAAEAAKDKGIPLCLSTFSICNIGTIRQHVGGALHSQLHMDREKSFVEHVLQSAMDANVDVLYLTVDTSVTSVRGKGVRNGFRALKRLNLPLALSMLRRPGWCLDLMKAGSPNVEALANYPEFGKGALEQAADLSGRLDPALTWDDVKWLRDKWKKELMINGILSVEDAKMAQECGADAIVISNHGGRQLDFASSTIAMLPDIRETVGGNYSVLIDGGFRRGSEIVIALVLGASSVLLVRAYAFGLAAAGKAGVTTAINILAHEISVTSKLMGLASVEELKSQARSCLRPVASPSV